MLIWLWTFSALPKGVEQDINFILLMTNMTRKSKSTQGSSPSKAKGEVINFFNFGTINIDARQNNSRTSKRENKGCTITPMSFSEDNGDVDSLQISQKATIAAAFKIVEIISSNKINKTKTDKTKQQ